MEIPKEKNDPSNRSLNSCFIKAKSEFLTQGCLPGPLPPESRGRSYAWPPPDTSWGSTRRHSLAQSSGAVEGSGTPKFLGRIFICRNRRLPHLYCLGLQ